MREFVAGGRRKSAFTLIELMIVVTIVAILALIAMPLYTANTVGAVMSEGIAGATVIRDQLRVYLAQNSTYAGATYTSATNNIGIESQDLNGKYFAPTDYSMTVVSSSQFLITVAPPSKSSITTLHYQINQDGSETSGSGFYTTGN